MKNVFLGFVLILGVSSAQQQQGGQGGAGAGAGASAGGTSIPGAGSTNPGVGRLPGTTTNPSQTPTQMPEMQRPIFLSGKVVMDDGSLPPEPVKIERVCNGRPRPEGYTDSKGRFSFQLGQNMGMMADASVSGSGADVFGDPSMSRSRSGGLGGGSMGGMGGGRGVNERDLMGCELRADLPGYRSDMVSLSGRRMMDNPDVGTIVLHRMAGVDGLATSFTTYAAPKDAKKAYEKAQELVKKKKLPEAQKELEKAVAGYPKYAIAWNLLGQLQQQGGSQADARKSFEQAVAADSKYVNPYLSLAMISAGENNWQDVADTTDRVIRLNPLQFPQAFFYNAVANYNLQKYDAAEKSAREAVKLDTQHRMPKAQHILGVLLAMKNDYAGAAENMKGYLQFARGASDAEAVQKQLTEIEKRLGQTQVTEQKAPEAQQQQ